MGEVEKIMMQPCHLFKAITGLALVFLLLSSLFAPTALAGLAIAINLPLA